VSSGALFADADFNGDGMVDMADWDAMTTAPNWGADLRDVWVLADLDGNFEVDDADLQTINDNFGMTGATYADGDLNGDGTIDIADVDLAFAQFGLGLNLVG